ncbi:MAG: phospholipid carrier-dependent glycosyltransferase, partial [Actinobacteria bacterium]|nr:phospholipid carrier-dependent glycosyltransferase [Actinomycetota bacterium]
MRMLSGPAARGAGRAGRETATAVRGLARTAAAAARRHWLLTLLVTVGAGLRAVTLAGYRPAIFYIDSIKYLLGAYPGNDPPGYELPLKALLALSNPFAVALVQHLLGLGMAIALYVLLLRRHAPRWLAALATAPVLLDGYELQMEHSIMPDVWFEALLVTALVVLLWRPRPAPWMLLAGGLALGACAAFRQVGEILALPALLYALLAAAPRWRRRLGHAAMLCAGFAVPILAASFANYLSIGQFALAPYAASTIYGRVAEVANCQRLVLPAYVRPLCPSPAQKRLGPDGLDHDLRSPIKTYVPPAGMHNHNLMLDFARRVVLQQPLSVAAAIGADTLRPFAVHRVTIPGDTPITRWQFQDAYPQYPPYVTIKHGQVTFANRTPDGTVQVLGTAARFGGGGPAVTAPLASFLRSYQLGGGYTPGPLLAFTAVAGLAGSLSLLRRRWLGPPAREAAVACLLIFASAVVLLLASDAFEFSWRYQLPSVVTLPPAAALAIAIPLLRRARSGTGTGPAAPGAPAS